MAGRGIVITEANLQCRTGCGYYGNPQWEGYCSQCWREHMQKQRSRVSVEQLKPRLEFSKFEEKKKYHVEKKTSTLRSILKKSPSSGDAAVLGTQSADSSLKPGRSREQQLSGPSRAAREHYIDWLERLTRPEQRFVRHHVASVVTRVGQESPEDISEHFQKAYETLGQKISSECVLVVENYLCTRLHSQLFCPPEDEQKDLSLQSRIRELRWVCQGILESGLNEAEAKVREHMNTAITKIVEVTTFRTPDEKLTNIVQCSQELMTGLKLSKDSPVSADEFLPALIFLLLRANPPLLQSNINFITRFAHPGKLMTGEQAYYFTNLCCAVSFIQNLRAESLRLTEAEFEGYMSGRLPPPAPHQPIFEPLEKMIQLANAFDLIEQRHAKATADAEAFRHLMNSESDQLLERILEVKEMFPVPITPSETDPLDAQISPDKEKSLPRPLEPTVA